MKINCIKLYNFGSYEGETTFDTKPTDDGRNIVLVGGKNGAGKTTLFTAMRVCLYGHMSMGYRSVNTFYTRAVAKLINNSAKMCRPTCASVEMQIAISNGRDEDLYTLKREWIYGESLSESFTVLKNTRALTESETADFEKYLLSLIPPELFNLYFFDGEKIADFFLEEGGNTRIKDAFLTFCGYDTFEIMRKNFKRISTGKHDMPALEEYLSAKDSVSDAMHMQQNLDAQLAQCVDAIDTAEADLAMLEKDYRQKGGVTQEEWNEKIFRLKEEEKKRETYNALLKKWANELIPFLMIRKQVQALKEQINRESDSQKYRNFCEVLESPAVRNLVEKKLMAIKQAALQKYGGRGNVILDLSIEQTTSVLAQIARILDFDTQKIVKCKRAVKRSLSLSAQIRKELDNSSISAVQEYMQKRAQLYERKSALLVQRIELEQQIVSNKEILRSAEDRLTRVKLQLEDDLKKVSIGDISARAIIMLDKLQHSLYKKQIQKVESAFRKEIKALMRKTHFIDDIQIDDDFSIHIYKTEDVDINRLRLALSTNTESQIQTMFGVAAWECLKSYTNAKAWDSVIAFFNGYSESTVTLPVEIDKTSLSNGEKQIFIMALYHSLVKLCSHEIPFIIDTPFARIDTEHRHNIAKHFFSKLDGQVFILSTNEEINSEHVQIMRDKIAATYLLENTDNKRTIVVNDKYFEV